MGEVTRIRSVKIKLDDEDVARIATEIVGRICKRPWLIAEIEKLASATGQTKGPDSNRGKRTRCCCIFEERRSVNGFDAQERRKADASAAEAA